MSFCWELLSASLNSALFERPIQHAFLAFSGYILFKWVKFWWLKFKKKLFLNSEGFYYPIFSRSLCMLAKIRNRPRSPDQEVDLGMCIICESSKKQVVIVPCGHICMCLKCMKKLKDSSRPRCPLCRGRILEFIYVYIWAFGSKLFH